MVRVPCCEKMGLKKGPWTPEEDQILISFVRQYGHENWRALPKLAGLSRCGKSCRLRWTNYLRPDIKRGNFSKEEEETIIKLHQILGNRWSAIANKLPGRTDNEIKNYWHTQLKKRVHQINLVSQNIFRSNYNQKMPETANPSNHRGFERNFEGRIRENPYNLDYCISAPRPVRVLAETNPKRSAKDNSVGSAADSRVQFPSTGEAIIEPGDDSCIKDDMVFWYNLFVNAGKSQES